MAVDDDAEAAIAHGIDQASNNRPPSTTGFRYQLPENTAEVGVAALATPAACEG